jgi:hypothetical protein
MKLPAVSLHTTTHKSPQFPFSVQSTRSAPLATARRLEYPRPPACRPSLPLAAPPRCPHPVPPRELNGTSDAEGITLCSRANALTVSV